MEATQHRRQEARDQRREKALDELQHEARSRETEERQTHLETSRSEADSTSSSNLGETTDDPLHNVRATTIDEFDKRTWHVIETVMSAHATLLIDGIEGCFGLIIVGPSGCGKSTALRPFEAVGIQPQFYRSDDITPASFVSHDASKSEDELQRDDLLPKIKHRTVLNPEMANWFGGDWAVREQKMAKLVRVMDGRGYTSNSGTHGERGYEGNYRFNFVGATTPLDKRDWDMMGHTGNRFLFHEMPAAEDEAADRDAIFGESEIASKIHTLQKVIQDFLVGLWNESDGANSINWQESPDEEVQDVVMYLAQLIRHARTPINDDGTPERESIMRVGKMVYDLARGRALLSGRNHVEMRDLDVCARVALSTMPRDRRSLVREIVQLDEGEVLRTQEVMDRLDVSRPTALNRMNELDNLGIGEQTELKVQGGETRTIEPRPKLCWPDDLAYPEF
jgi:hypothetical protein